MANALRAAIQSLKQEVGKGGAAKRHGVSGRVTSILDVLERRGTVLDSESVADLERCIAQGEAGDAVTQCSHVTVVCILYTNLEPSEEQIEWYNRQRRFVEASGALHSGGTIDMSQLPKFAKSLEKSTVLVLERALKKHGLFLEWKAARAMQLSAAGFPKATEMLNRVIALSEKMFKGRPDRQLIYLQNYFFDEFMGLGLPADYAPRSALAASASDADPAKYRRPAVNSEYDLALSDVQDVRELAGGSSVGSGGGQHSRGGESCLFCDEGALCKTPGRCEVAVHCLNLKKNEAKYSHKQLGEIAAFKKTLKQDA